MLTPDDVGGCCHRGPWLPSGSSPFRKEQQLWIAEGGGHWAAGQDGVDWKQRLGSRRRQMAPARSHKTLLDDHLGGGEPVGREVSSMRQGEDISSVLAHLLCRSGG